MPAPGPGRDRRRGRGQSLVELAITIPILIAILLIAVDVGRVYFGWVTLSNIARIGANFAAQNPDAWQGSGDSTIKSRYQTLMRKDASGIDCTLPSTLPDPNFSGYDLGSHVTVTLNCTFALVTPFLSSVFGDGSGTIAVNSSAVFTIRSGSVNGVVISDSAPDPDDPTPSPSPSPSPSPTPTPGGSPDPSASPTPTAVPRVISFWGESTSTDASGGGPPGSPTENQIIGVDPLTVTFYNTSTGPNASSCDWDFGDGDTGSSCGNQVSHTYTEEGLYTVTLDIDGTAGSRVDYVLVACKVPAFAGVRVNSAPGIWTSAGFSASNFVRLPGPGNYKIGFQSLAGGLVNPAGGCSGASIIVGP